ncbi:unnamed protein product [Adineta steineri]|uniref:G-protein coupled receptors family 1 profile domain-containing protein n=1 Tax=Adineta steineri TaxID=433720 RepID=A0A813W5S0_9BILA|nr:unnamed protein product [Adineta steineri]CAF1329162.1 unnamed protein product [Adineta steineri]
MASSLVAALALGQIILIEYVESALFVLGITGSFLNILLFSQRKFRSNSCCTYLLASAVAALVLILMAIIPQLYALNHTPNSLFNANFCKAQGYMTQVSAMLCRWLLTIACIDRCLLTSTNARLRLFATVHIAKKIILLLHIIWLIFPIHMLLFADVRRIGYITCMLSTDSSALYHSIYSIIAGGFLPTFIMLICAKHIWKNLQLKRQRRGMIDLQRRQSKREIRNIQILIMLLLQVIIFILFTFPYMSFNLYLTFTRSVTNKSADRLAIESFMQLFTGVTVLVHPAISFYSNTMVSQTYRNELIILFRKFIVCDQRQRFHRGQRVAPNTIFAITDRRNALPMVVLN